MSQIAHQTLNEDSLLKILSHNFNLLRQLKIVGEQQ